MPEIALPYYLGVMKLLTIFLLALLLVPSSALAASHEEAEQELFDASLTPTALYPDDLPSRLSDADTTVNFPSGIDYQVRFDLPSNEGYFVLQRKSKGKFKKELRSIRSEGFKPEKKRVGKMRAYWACGHVCGFLWQKGGKGYTLFGMYYKTKIKRLFADQRQFIKGLAPVEDQYLSDEDFDIDDPTADDSTDEDLTDEESF